VDDHCVAVCCSMCSVMQSDAGVCGILRLSFDFFAAKIRGRSRCYSVLQCVAGVLPVFAIDFFAAKIRGRSRCYSVLQCVAGVLPVFARYCVYLLSPSPRTTQVFMCVCVMAARSCTCVSVRVCVRQNNA